MSEYQYYEFRAIDQPLSEKEMDKLSAISSRAEITATSFTNTYNYGDFRGDPEALVERYFDAFVYVTNWGTHQLMFRLPKGFLDIKAAAPYGSDETLSFKAKSDHIIVDFTSDDESRDEWTEGEPWMASLIALRGDLMRGDLRALYLGWLASLRFLVLDEDPEVEAQLEPPVPPGLAKLSGPLKELASFLWIDDELIEAAARGSAGEPPAAPSLDVMRGWVKQLSAADKDAYLLRFLTEEGDLILRAELARQFRDATRPTGTAPAADAARRTVGQLLAARDEIVEAKRLTAAEKAAKERARKERERTEARTKHLDDLAGRESAAWQEVDDRIAAGQAKEYDQAVTLLADLRELAARTGRTAEVDAKIQALRQLHKKKPSLIKRFDTHKLGT
ncbi:hypothetical protein SAMN05444166_6005 [Singulisphaera sp. GP187]|uniref:hypothetical protein n=1 Tax=Singulisphaera sp. GP187 TaxID=1882752 RepID=UPI0009267722|nr:hypothetical protein [Singulisphaera sp. GP187]SIO59313.1 hypothetical protein SAMN05444166_6005 [Singulisphaera sp. GP187]